MAVLSIRWESADRISPKTSVVTPREGEEAPAEEPPAEAADTNDDAPAAEAEAAPTEES